MYYYEGSSELKIKSNKIEGKIIITGGQNYENKEIIITENLETLEATTLITEIKQVIL